jgi:DNA-binding beta-propeller fold protein YncE
LEESVLGTDKGKPIGKPYGITTVKGKIFICDAQIRGIDVIDLEKKDFFQFTPGGRGQLKLPINCHISEDRIYITDVSRGEVVVFDNKYNYVDAIGKSDEFPSFRPLDVCATPERLWVANPFSHQIIVYNKESSVVGSYSNNEQQVVSKGIRYKMEYAFPDTIPGTDEYLFNPLNLAYHDGKVYVTDFGDFKVKIFTEKGEYLESIGGMGTGIGTFIRPKGISVDQEGNLFVVDAGFENVQIFDKDGKYLMHFGGPYNGHGDMWLPAKVHIDYENLDYFQKYVSPEFELKYLVYVTNQYGPDKVSVYGAVQLKTVRN